MAINRIGRVRFGPALRDFFSSLGEFSFKGGGFEATAKRKQAEAAAALVAASVAHPDATATPATAAQRAGEAAAVVAESVNAQVELRHCGSMIDQRTMSTSANPWRR